LVIHEYLNADHARVKKTISGLKEIVGRTSDVKGISLEQQRGEAETVAGRTFSDQFARAVDFESEFDTKKTYGFFVQMEDLAKSLRYLPGYKNIILFSQGFPNYLYGHASRNSVGVGDLMFREYHDAMAKEMSSSNSPVFTVNAEGRRAHLRDRDNRGDYSLKNMSQVSGGQYFENIDEHEKIAEGIQQATSNYYVLGYYIGENWDGEYHEVKVEVRRKGLKVRAQRGYFNPKPFSKFSKSEKLLHLLDLALNDDPQLQQPVPLPLVTLNCSEAPDSNLAILSEIPRELLEEVTSKKAEIVALIFDEFNFMVDEIKEEFDLKKINPEYRFFAYVANLSPGNYRCSLIVRNTETGRAAVGSAGIEIPEPLESGFRMYPPLLLVPEEAAVYYKFKKIKRNEGEASVLSPYYPSSAEHSPLVQELPGDTRKVLAMVRSFSAGIPAPTVAINFHLIGEETETKTGLSASVLSTQWQESYFIQILELELPAIEPGIYTLEAFTPEEISGKSFRHSQQIRIK
jgi:VWFA-related protein